MQAHSLHRANAFDTLCNMIDAMPKTPTLTIRIPGEVLEWVQQTAQAETRSVNGQIVQLLKEARACRDQRFLESRRGE